MQAFRNTKFTKRDCETTNIVACVADAAPGDNWELADGSALLGLAHLYTQAGVRYYGYI